MCMNMQVIFSWKTSGSCTSMLLIAGRERTSLSPKETTARIHVFGCLYFARRVDSLWWSILFSHDRVVNVDPLQNSSWFGKGQKYNVWKSLSEDKSKGKSATIIAVFGGAFVPQLESTCDIFDGLFQIARDIWQPQSSCVTGQRLPQRHQKVLQACWKARRTQRC